jgi:FAD/FMN-containing dehydrogenase
VGEYVDSLTQFASEVGMDGSVTIAGMSTRGGAVADVRCVHAPSGVRWVEADEMIVCCGAGTGVDDLNDALAVHGQFVALPPRGSVGGALAVGRSDVRRLGLGPVRDVLLQAIFVGADGALVKAGGPTVKNVSGFDLCRLLVGSRGTLGFLGEVILRSRPLPRMQQWFTVATNDPTALFTRLYRPVSVLWDGGTAWVLLHGHPQDVASAASAAGLTEADGPPPLPPLRTVIAPRQVVDLRGAFVAEVGVGVVHGDCCVTSSVPPAPAALSRRIKDHFDPTGRLNPGLAV